MCVIEHNGEGMDNASVRVAMMLERNQLATRCYLLKVRSGWKLAMLALSLIDLVMTIHKPRLLFWPRDNGYPSKT